MMISKKMRFAGRILCLVFLMAATTLIPGPVLGQDDEGPLDWIYGPAECNLGSIAKINLPDGYQFVDGDGTRTIMEWFENPTGGAELGLVMPVPRDDGELPWFIVFEYDPIGYVKDDEKDDLDADSLIESIIKGTEHSNEIRRQNGWAEFHVTGWEIPPYYDVETNNLKWAIVGTSTSGETVNFSTRLLGRGGAMSADLVIDPESLRESLPAYESLIAGFSFSQGNKYAEFRKGDKIAKYGLTALIAGGAGAVAMKTGLLARFWKLIVVGVLALFGFFRRLFGRLFNRESE